MSKLISKCHKADVQVMLYSDLKYICSECEQPCIAVKVKPWN